MCAMVRIRTTSVMFAILLLAVQRQAFAQEQAASETPLALATDTPAQPNADAAAKLQAAAANPLASLISLPFQGNANFDVGPLHATGASLNIQPVVPLPISKKTTMILRTIVPFTYVPQLSTNPLAGSVFGLGMINPQLYFVPRNPGSVTIGPGVTFLLPTSTNPLVGPNKWAIGPDIAVVKPTKYTLYGFIANNLWSFAGSPNGLNINSFFIQPFYVRNFAHGVGIGANSQTTANWNAPGNQKWTVPLFVSISQLQKPASIPLSVLGGIGYNVIRPVGAGTWFVRLQVTMLYPAAKS